jgi:hypothetical protein
MDSCTLKEACTISGVFIIAFFVFAFFAYMELLGRVY